MPRHVRQRTKFKPGDKVEFLSATMNLSPLWKPAVVDSIPNECGQGINLRLHVGNGVYIIRPAARCRKVG